MTSVDKKLWVALTGIGLSGFVLMHMSGNLLLLAGPELFNKYGHAMISNPLLIPAEIGLVAIFLVHVYLAITLNLKNRAARGVCPSERASCAKAARFGSKYMVLTGLLVFVFVILHLRDFKYGAHYTVTYDGVEMRDLYRIVHHEFHETGEVGLYVFAMLVLFVHLAHGVSAVFQSLGLGSVKNCCLKKIGWGFALLVAGGFILQPLYIYFMTPGGTN